MIIAGDLNQSPGERDDYGDGELRSLLAKECQAADLNVLTSLAHMQVPPDQPVIDHVAVAPARGQRAHLHNEAGWEGAWERPGRLSDPPRSRSSYISQRRICTLSGAHGEAHA